MPANMVVRSFKPVVFSNPIAHRSRVEVNGMAIDGHACRADCSDNDAYTPVDELPMQYAPPVA